MSGQPQFDRREVIVGAVASSIAGEAHAETREPLRLTPDQARIRSEGIRAMQRSAGVSRNEEARVFVVRSDGRAEWISVRMRQQSASVGAGETSMRMIVGSIDREVLDRTIRLAQNGAHVEYAHTHPTQIGDTQTPPSPYDFISSVELSRRTRDTRGSVSTTAVCEAGTYKYGPSSPEAAERLLSVMERAVQPSVENLRENRSGGRTLAQHLERAARENGTPIPREVTDAIANGRLPDAMLNHPPSVLGIALIESMVDSSVLPQEALSYLSNIVLARDALINGLKTIDPQTDGLLNMPPANGNDTAYFERWRRLGMSVTFEPHPAS